MITDKLYLSLLENLQKKGIECKHLVMVAYAMAYASLTYTEARDYYAEYLTVAPEVLQSWMCYDILRAGLEESPSKIVAELLKEESA